MIKTKIAMAGKMRAGKDTAVNFFTARHPDYLHLKFADPLYAIHDYVKAMCGFTDKEKHRALLQYIGSDYARNINPNVWVDQLLLRSNLKSNMADLQLVSDARYNNEFAGLAATGWILVKIMRPELDRIDAGATWKSPLKTKLATWIAKIGARWGFQYLPILNHLSHMSERDVDDYRRWDYIIYNDGTMSDYTAKLLKLEEMILADGGKKKPKPVIL